MPEIGAKLGLAIDVPAPAVTTVAGSASGSSAPVDPSFSVLTDDSDGYTVAAVAHKVCEVVREHELLRELSTFTL